MQVYHDSTSLVKKSSRFMCSLVQYTRNIPDEGKGMERRKE